MQPAVTGPRRYRLPLTALHHGVCLQRASTLFLGCAFLPAHLMPMLIPWAGTPTPSTPKALPHSLDYGVPPAQGLGRSWLRHIHASYPWELRFPTCPQMTCEIGCSRVRSGAPVCRSLRMDCNLRFSISRPLGACVKFPNSCAAVFSQIPF